MLDLRPEFGRELSASARHLKGREEAFAQMLAIFEKFNQGHRSTIRRLPSLVKKYSQFLSASDREPMIKAVDTLLLNFFNLQGDEKKDWAHILSLVMRSGVNRCDSKSPGIQEASRLVAFSPFRDRKIIAHVTAFAIISPYHVLEPVMHHSDYHQVRRLIYTTIVNAEGADICMGAEYFIAGYYTPETHFFSHPYTERVVLPIDRRENR